MQRAQAELDIAKHETELAEAARDVVTAVMLVTQGQVKTFIEETVTLALATVYGSEYALEIEYKVRRNQSEAALWIRKGEDRFNPRDEIGGGVVDIASLALRLALYALTIPRPDPVLILDEPARFLSTDKQPLFGQMLRQVAEYLGVQIIIVSHSAEIIEAADRAYEIDQRRGISTARKVR